MNKLKAKTNSHRLTAAEKINIIDYIEKHPDVCHTKVAKMYEVKFRKPVNRRSIRNYLNAKEKNLKASTINAQSYNVTKERKYEKINQSLIEWLTKLEIMGATYNEKIIKEKAILLSKEYDISGFSASDGWLQSFKSLYGINQKILSGEASYRSKEDYADFYVTFQGKLLEYQTENIFNCDETALFFKQAPSKGLMKTSRKGIKLLKDRITILFCSNMTGSIKLKPTIIGKFKSPRCLKHFNYSELCEYLNNSSAWMTAYEFNHWLLRLDRKMKLEKRKILLLLDNCPSHKINIKMENVEALFLPKNSTSVTQPLDSGIIKSFKGKYFHLLLSNAITKMTMQNINAESAFKEFNLKDAMLYTSIAWNNISSEVIFNCWRNAGYVFNDNSPVPDQNTDFSDIQVAIDALDIEDAVMFNEYITDAVTEDELLLTIAEMPDTAGIAYPKEMSLKCSEITDVDVMIESTNPNSTIDLQDVLRDLVQLKSFITHDDIIKPNFLMALAELELHLTQKVLKTKKSKITDFLHVK